LLAALWRSVIGPANLQLAKLFRRSSAKDHVWRTVVGVVSDIKDFSLAAESSPTLYIPASQNSIPSLFLVARTSVSPESVQKPVQRALWQLDKDLAISDIKSMEDVFSESLSGPRFSAYLISIFAFIGVTLAAVGTYAMISYHAAQRTNEIGIRIAIGASQYDVLWLVLKQALVLSATGVLIGLVIARSLSRFIAGFVFGISPTDARTYIAVAVLLLAIGIVASYFPARRASKLHPTIALNT
jgi:putative ABC transport system permease protein